MQLVFATHNRNKVREVQRFFGDRYAFRGLSDIGCEEDIPETSPTILGNALQKARYVYEKFGENCFSEDTGLEIDALHGAPGVYTARYAGEDKDPNANMNLVLGQMQRVPASERTARFRTIFALIINGEEHTFEGVVEGHIATERLGDGGFGYDPIFVPLGETRSFAQMPLEEKNKISHRGIAVRKLADYLLNLP